MNNNLLLYGSMARGDSTKDSDIDLLTVGDDINNKFIYNHLNISYYNINKFKEMANSGSLFLFHLNQEAKIIYDYGGILKRLVYNEFTLKEHYFSEIHFAYDLILEIFRSYNETMNFSFANSKIVWGLRTIYSALGANDAKPIFSSRKIIENFGTEAIDYLSIKKKSTNQSHFFPKITHHLNTIIQIRDIEVYEIDDGLQEFKERILSCIRQNNKFGENHY